MRRFHLIEIMDQPWCPGSIRNFCTEFLEYSMNKFETYKPVYQLIVDTMSYTESTSIIDLCSGSGGPILDLNKYFFQNNYYYKIYLTDKFPNNDMKQKLKNEENVFYVNESINAMEVPNNYQGMRTLFTAFHHFKPGSAYKILEDAVNNDSAIGIFEFTERKLFSIFKMLFIPINVWIFTLFIKPRSLNRFIFTYVIPIVPFVLFWDGIVSCLRTYTPSELNRFILKFENRNYVWKIGKLYSKKSFCNISYFIGYPK